MEKITVKYYYLENNDFITFLKNFNNQFNEWVDIIFIDYLPFTGDNPQNFPGLPFITFTHKNKNLRRYNILGNDKSKFLQNLNIIKNIK